MIVSPDWSTLRGVAAGLDSADPIQRQRALEQTIQLVTDELPDVKAVRLYVLDGQKFIVRAATDFEQKAVKSLSVLPLAAQALERDASAWKPDEGHWSMPLAAMGTTLGVFEVLAPEVDDEWMTWLSVIGDRVAKALALAEQPTRSGAIE